MIGSFIGMFAVGLLSAHVYHNGRSIKKKLDKGYDAMCDFFRLTEEDEARERSRRNPTKKDRS